MVLLPCPSRLYAMELNGKKDSIRSWDFHYLKTQILHNSSKIPLKFGFIVRNYNSYLFLEPC